LPSVRAPAVTAVAQFRLPTIMKKLLSLAFVLLSVATATAFAAPSPVVTDTSATTQVASAQGQHRQLAKKAHKKHKKHRHRKK